MQIIQSDLDIYELAYLADGVPHVSKTMAINLIEGGFLLWDVAQKKFARLEGVDETLTHLEKQLIEALVNSNVDLINTIKDINLLKIAIIQEDLKRYGIHHAHFLIFMIGCHLLYRGLLLVCFFWSFFLLFGGGIVGFLVVLLAGMIGALVYDLNAIPITENATKLHCDRIKQIQDNLLEMYRQQTPAHPPFLNSSLSKAYALYGSAILTDSKFDGLSEFLNQLFR